MRVGREGLQWIKIIPYILQTFAFILSLSRYVKTSNLVLRQSKGNDHYSET